MAYNLWQEYAVETAELKQKLRHAAARVSPEGRAKSKFIQLLVEIAETMRKMRKVTGMFRPDGKMFALWKRKSENQKKKADGLRKGGSALFMRAARGAFNQWLMVWEAMNRARQVLMSLAPRGRMMKLGFQAFMETYYETFVGRQGDAQHTRKQGGNP